MRKRGNGIFTKRTLSNFLVAAACIVLFILLSNFVEVRSALGWFFSIFAPFVVGVVFAYLLDMPTRFFERHVFQRFKRSRGLSIVTVYVLMFALVAVLISLVLPQVVQSALTIVNNVPSYLQGLNDAVDWLNARFHLPPELLEMLAMSYSDIVTSLSQWVQDELPRIADTLVNMTVSIGSGLMTFLTAFITSVYVLFSKKKLMRQSKKLIYAVLPQRGAGELFRVGRLANGVFTGFISGKIIDSAIIGVLCFILMSIMSIWVEMPFTLLISIVVGITNVIPFFGPFIGAIPSIMILLLVNPWSAVWFAAMILLLQQFDGNILGPKILGDSTGLPALWVLIAIVIGGRFFGFNGMVLGVPTTAVLYTLISDFVAKRLRKKNIDGEGQPLDAGAAAELAAVDKTAGEKPPQ